MRYGVTYFCPILLFSAGLSESRPIPRFDLLKGFEQVVIRAGLRFFRFAVDRLHHFGIEDSEFFKLEKVPRCAGERCVQTGQQFIDVGLLVAGKIISSHCFLQ